MFINYRSSQEENIKNKLFRAIKTYNMRAYKQLIFDIFPRLRAGEVVGKKIGDSLYEVELITDDTFRKIYGSYSIIYKIEKKNIYIEEVKPLSFLEAGSKTLLDSYKGIPVISDKEKFKIDILSNIDKIERR